jgi:hypothetical protein
MTTDNWKGHVNGILYGIQFDRVLDDVVARVANGVTAGLYPGGRDETVDALGEALRYQGPLNDQVEAPHSEEDIRAFLHRLVAALGTRG